MSKKKKMPIVIGVLSLILLTSLLFVPVLASSLKEKKPSCPFDPKRVRIRTEEMREKYVGHQRDDLPYRTAIEQQSKDVDITSLRSTEKEGWWGAAIDQQYRYHMIFGYVPTVWGAFGKHYINESLVIGDNVSWFYAPSMKPPKPCPLEAVTVYHKDSGGQMERFLGIWNHNDEGSFTEEYTFSQLDSEGYLATDAGGSYYEVVISYDTSSYYWAVYLHEFSSNWWDEIEREYDDNYDHSGWDYYEGFWNGTWQENEYIRACDIMVYHLYDWWDYEWIYNEAPIGDELDLGDDFGQSSGFYDDYYDWYVGG